MKNHRIVEDKGNKLKSLKYLVLTVLTKKKSLLNQLKKKVKYLIINKINTKENLVRTVTIVLIAMTETTVMIVMTEMIV